MAEHSTFCESCFVSTVFVFDRVSISVLRAGFIPVTRERSLEFSLHQVPNQCSLTSLL